MNLQQAFDLLPTDATFMQVGAYDGVDRDPYHRAIVDRGWRGVLVEPQPWAFNALKTNYKEQLDRLSVEQCAIGALDGYLTMWYIEPGPGFVDPENKAMMLTSFLRLWTEREALGHGIKNFTLDELQVRVRPLYSLLQKHEIVHLDALFVDTEGLDALVIAQCLEAVRLGYLKGLPKVIVFEQSPETDMAGTEIDLLLQGYKLEKDGNNTVATLGE